MHFGVSFNQSFSSKKRPIVMLFATSLASRKACCLVSGRGSLCVSAVTNLSLKRFWFNGIFPFFTASKHLLYVKRAAPIQLQRIFFCKFDGRIRIFKVRSSVLSFPPEDFKRPSRVRFFGGSSVSFENVETAGKDKDERQEVDDELVLGKGILVVENHEFDVLSFEKPRDELEAERVPMGYAHFK